MIIRTADYEKKVEQPIPIILSLFLMETHTKLVTTFLYIKLYYVHRVLQNQKDIVPK